MLAVGSTRSSYLHATAHLSIKGVNPILTFWVREENIKHVFLKKVFCRCALPQIKRSAMSTQWQGQGGVGGEGGFTLPALQGKFWNMTTFKWRFLASETQFNSLLSIHNTLQYDIVFNTITFCTLCIVSFVSISYSVFKGWKMANIAGKIDYVMTCWGAMGNRGF